MTNRRRRVAKAQREIKRLRLVLNGKNLKGLNYDQLEQVVSRTGCRLDALHVHLGADVPAVYS